MRRAHRVDKNQKEIIEALRKAGRSVFDTSGVGFGFPDIVVGRDGKTFLIEIKDGKNGLTGQQTQLLSDWRGDKIHVVKSVEEALKITS